MTSSSAPTSQIWSWRRSSTTGEVARPCSARGRYFTVKLQGRARPGVTEETFIIVGVAAMVDTNIKEVVGWKENFLGSQRGGSPWCCGYKMSGVLGLRKHRSSIGGWTRWSSRCLGSRRSSRSSSTSTTLCSGRSKSLPALRLRTTALACNMNKVCKKNYIRCIHSCVVEVIYKQIQDSYNSSG